MVQITVALISFNVSMDQDVWTQPRPAMVHMTALITVMRATVHVSDPLATEEGTEEGALAP